MIIFFWYKFFKTKLEIFICIRDGKTSLYYNTYLVVFFTNVFIHFWLSNELYDEYILLKIVNYICLLLEYVFNNVVFFHMIPTRVQSPKNIASKTINNFCIQHIF